MIDSENELIVLKADDCPELIIARKDWFKECQLSECYGSHGQILGGDVEDETVMAYHYWDGHNMCSIIIREAWLRDAFDWEILDDEDAEAILAAYEEVVWPSQFKYGCRSTVINGYEFSQALYEWDWGIAMVREL